MRPVARWAPLLTLVLVLPGPSLETVDTLLESEPREVAEDCDQSLQYYEQDESRCRNCSEKLRVFQPASNQDWQPHGENNKRNEQDKPAASSPSQDSRARADFVASVIGVRLTPLPPSRPASAAAAANRWANPSSEPGRIPASEALARLVLANDDPSLTDDGAWGQPAAGNGTAGPLVSQPPNNGANSFQELASDEEGAAAAGLQAQEQTNLAKSARLWQRLIASFLQSDEISESGLLDSVEQCRAAQNLAACQQWANMCVMTMYSHSAEHRQTQAAPAPRRAPIFAGNTARMSERVTGARRGWQQCAKFTPMTVCNSWREWRRLDGQQTAPATSELGDIFGSEDVEASLSSRMGALQGAPLRVGQQIQVVAYEYAFDGRLLGVNQFGLDDFGKFCLFSPAGSLLGGGGVNAGAAPANGDNLQPNDERALRNRRSLRVGANMEMRCQFSAAQANALAPRHLNQTKFIDLFVGYQLNGAAFVKPVPILIKNLLYQNQLVNALHAKDPTRWRFVHRYFPFATIKLGGRTASAEAAAAAPLPLSRQRFQDDNNNDNNNSGGAPDQDREVLLFVRSANFELKLRRQQDKGLVISSMLLVLDYDHLQLVRGRRAGDGAAAVNASSSSVFAAGSSVSQLESRVQVSQQLAEMLAYPKDLDLLVTIVSIASSIWALIKCYNIQKYQGLIKLDARSLCLFLVIACDIIANILGVVALAAALFLFSALKFQALAEQQLILAPDENLEQNLLLKVMLALLLKLLGFLYKLTVRLSADSFFIDWERPRMLTSTQIMGQQQRAAADAAAKLKTTDNTGKTNPLMNLIQQQQQQQTSFWRPYTIINRWLQMQTLRRQNLTLQLVAFVGLVELLQLDRLATAEPSFVWPPLAGDDSQPAHPLKLQLRPVVSASFRALILALVYLALAVAQFLYKRHIHEPMIRCPVREFVDLCSVGNVSLFSMLYPRFGFYVHGRNANGSADCGLVEMNVLLEREERDLCSRRGLLANSDEQTFVLVLPKIINDHYRKLLFRADPGQLVNGAHQPLTLNGNRSPLGRPQQAGELIRSALSLPLTATTTTTATSRSFGTMRAYIESVVARNRAINVFLTNFLDHAYKDIDYSVRRRRRFESLLMEIDLDDEDDDNHHDHDGASMAQRRHKLAQSARGGSGAAAAAAAAALAINQHNGSTGESVQATGGGQNFDRGGQLAATFFVDTSNAFVALIWLGFEWDLVVIELLLLLNIDLCLCPDCLILSVALIWLMNKLFQSVYRILARKNLIIKSMLDEKFLIRT